MDNLLLIVRIILGIFVTTTMVCITILLAFIKALFDQAIDCIETGHD